MSDTAKMEIKPRTLRALACDIEDCHNPQSWADYCRAAAAMLETQAARIAELEAALVTARREGMEEAAKCLEELHKNHNYDPESGTLTRKLGRYEKWPESAKTAKLEHDAGYYRAISEGVAHILYAAA